MLKAINGNKEIISGKLYKSMFKHPIY